MSKIIITFSVVLVFSIPARAGQYESTSVGSSYLRVLNAFDDRLGAELALERYRLGQLQGLLQRGHASWLETRKQQLKVDQLAAECAGYTGFVASLCETDRFEQLTGMPELNPAVLQFTDLVFHDPDDSLGDSENELDQLLSLVARQLDQRQMERDQLQRDTNALSTDDPWKAHFQLRLEVANAKVRYLESRIELLRQQRSALGERPGSAEATDEAGDSRNVLLCPSIDRLKFAAEQCAMHGQLITYRLEIERNRLVNLEQLRQNGMGSHRDLQLVQQNVDRLAQLLDRQHSVARWLNTCISKSSMPGNKLTALANSACPASNWLQIKKSFAKFEAQYQRRSAELETEMLQEILARLEAAVDASDAVDLETPAGMARTLAKVRQNELRTYRQRIQFGKLKIQLAVARMNSLSHQSEADTDELQIEMKATAPALLRPILASVSLSVPGSNSASLLFASGRSNDSSMSVSHPADIASLAIRENPGFFPTQFREIDGDYLAVKLIDHHRLLRLRYRSPVYSLNSGSPLRFDASAGRLPIGPPRSFAPVDSRDSRSGKLFDRVYYNGIIRSELRPFLNPGQPPWYLPGSPTNLRYRQLNTDYQRDAFGRTGNELLRTRVYTDLHGR